MLEDWKSKRIRQIRIRVGLTVTAGLLILAYFKFKNQPVVNAQEPNAMEQELSVPIYDLESVKAKESMFNGTTGVVDAHRRMTSRVVGLENWCTRRRQLSVELLHTVSTAEGVGVIEHTYCDTDNVTHTTHLSTVDADVWYSMEDSLFYVQPAKENNYCKYTSIDVFGRQSILDSTVYSSAVTDVTNLIQQLISMPYRASVSAASGDLSVRANGLLANSNLPTTQEISDNDNFTLYLLQGEDAMYVHLRLTYLSGGLTHEDIWYKLVVLDSPVEFPTDMDTESIKTNRNISELLGGV